MTSLELTDGWFLGSGDGRIVGLPAPVPGCVHDALLAAGAIPDIAWRFNERECQWVGEQDWIYERHFDLSDDLLANDNIELVCEGLDTLCDVTLNGAEVASTDNMFRRYSWDVKRFARAGHNLLRLRFRSVLPVIRARSAERLLPAWNELEPGRHWGHVGRGYVRKQACQFGWDWGPVTVSAGPYLPVRIVAWSKARLEDWRTEQRHEDGRVTVTVHTTLAGPTFRGMRVRAALQHRTTRVAAEADVAPDGTASVELVVTAPHLWWPAGFGAQPLYTLTVQALGADSRVLDGIDARLGLRTLRWATEPDEHGRPFALEVNGRRVFATGANVIPLDQYPSSQGLERYRTLLRDARDANLFLLRVWGGGYYLHDAFYDLCDELGLCVWQDMMFGCGTYPVWDDAFVGNVARETADAARRLRHHACLALWCGNNELEAGLTGDTWTDKTMSWADYVKLFEDVIPAALRTADPVTHYIPGSPHSGPEERRDGNSPRSGDCHLWEIWFSNAPFENYRNYPHRFLSEFGFQSFPHPATTASFTLPADRAFNTPVMEFHERSQPGVRRVLEILADWFRLPDSFEDQAWLTQIVHGLGMKIGVEHWRQTWPRCAGATYWQLNDVWPGVTWSSIDGGGRWKALQWMARRFFAPVLVSGREDVATGVVRVHVHNNTLAPVSGEVVALVTTVSGQEVVERRVPVRLEALEGVWAVDVDVAQAIAVQGADNLIVWLFLESGGDVVGSNVVLLARPRLLRWIDPGLVGDVVPAGNRYRVRLRAARPALWAWVDLGSVVFRASDNFVCVHPDRPVEIDIEPATAIGLEEFHARLRVRSVWDTVPGGNGG